MSVFIFPGVGSHLVGMGKEFFDAYPEQIKIADQVLGYSIKELCLEDPRHLLDHTEYVQPALFIVCMLNFWNELATGTPLPHYLAGHSMGETCALCCAGVFDFETGVRITQQRGELMAKVSRGGMAVIIGLNAAEVQAV